MYGFRQLVTTFSRTLDRKLRSDIGWQFSRYPYRGWAFFNRGRTKADLKCEGKEASESDKLTIEVIGVTRISVQSFTKLVCIGSKSHDLHGSSPTR